MKHRTGFAALGAALVLAGAAWGGSLAPATQAQATPPTITRPLVDGRTLVRRYRESRRAIRRHDSRRGPGGRMSPTGFQLPDDDLLRRFFGDRFGDQFDAPQGPRSRTPRTFRQRGLGSGVVVSGDGYILTNHHVIDEADNITVEFNDGRSLKAKVIGSDQLSDLAVLKVEASDLKPVALANSDDAQVGDVVLAVGNPLGVGQTVTMGIVSAKGRQTDGDSFQDFIQTDAPINQGNSGGALVNLEGELLGINSQILSPSQGNIGIGFAIPANMARRVMDDLKKNGRVRRSQLGVVIQPVTQDMAESLGLKDTHGVIVSSVSAGSAAERAGVQAGRHLEVVQRAAGERRQRAAQPRGRDGARIERDARGRPRREEKTLAVKLDERSEPSARSRCGAGTDKTALGVSVAPLTPQLAERAGLPKDAQGLVVQDVDPDGRAADAGIQRGDIIREVNRQPIQSVEDLRAAVKRTSDRPALILVNRGDRSMFVTVRPS